MAETDKHLAHIGQDWSNLEPTLGFWPLLREALGQLPDGNFGSRQVRQGLLLGRAEKKI